MDGLRSWMANYGAPNTVGSRRSPYKTSLHDAIKSMDESFNRIGLLRSNKNLLPLPSEWQTCTQQWPLAPTCKQNIVNQSQTKILGYISENWKRSMNTPSEVLIGFEHTPFQVGPVPLAKLRNTNKFIAERLETVIHMVFSRATLSDMYKNS